MVATVLITLVRGGVGALFLVYSIEKLLDRPGFGRVLKRYLPKRAGGFTSILSLALPVTEITLGLLFLFGVCPIVVGAYILALLVLFTVALVKKWVPVRGAAIAAAPGRKLRFATPRCAMSF